MSTTNTERSSFYTWNIAQHSPIAPHGVEKSAPVRRSREGRPNTIWMSEKDMRCPIGSRRVLERVP